MKKNKNILFGALIILAAAVITANPAPALEGARDGIRMSLETAAPSLFIFMVLSETAYGLGVFSSGKISSALSKTSGIPPSCACAVIFSFIGGYPVGIRLIKKEFDKNDIDIASAKRLISFCVNAGPGFIINTVGLGVLKSGNGGICVLASTILSSLIIASARLAAYKLSKKNTSPLGGDLNLRSDEKTISGIKTFTSAVSSGANSIILICAWIVLFSAFRQTFFSFINNENIKSVLRMTLEVTDGVYAAGEYSGAPMCAAVTSFGGMCVFMQLLPYLTEMGIKPAYYLLTRAENGALAYLICSAITKLFPLSLEASAVGNSLSELSPSALPNAIMLIGVGVMIISDNTDVINFVKRFFVDPIRLTFHINKYKIKSNGRSCP